MSHGIKIQTSVRFKNSGRKMKVTRHCEEMLHNYVIWQRNSMSDFEISVGCSKYDS